MFRGGVGLVVGDIRDLASARLAMRDVDDVLHKVAIRIT